MTSSTSLYSSTPGNANVASSNFTTLYSGSGTINPTQAYGNANVVSLLATSTDGGNTIGNISATGNVTADYFIGDGSQLTNINAGNISGNVNFANTAGTAQYVTANAQANITSVGTLTSLSVTGNITGGNLLTGGTITAAGNVTAPYFIGNLSGNIAAAGANTQIQFNTGNLLDASANLTFDKSTSTLKVTGNATYPTSGIEITKSSIVGNLTFGNLLITNQFQGTSRGAVVIDTTELIVGQDNAALSTNATVRAIRNQALELTTTNAGAPAVYVGKYVANNASLTGNVDVRSSNVGGYGGTGNINLSGNVYVGRNAQGADAANAKANLIVTDSVYVNQNLSVAGNISIPNLSTTGNITAGNFITSGNLYGNVVATTLTGTGTANLDINNTGDANVTIRQRSAVNGTGAVYVDANNLIIGNVGNSSKLVAAPSNDLVLAVSGTGGAQMYVGQAAAGNLDLRSSGTAISGGFAANGNINLSGNVFIGNAAQQTSPASTGLNLNVAGTISAAGNITGNYFIGNGSQLTGLPATYGNANVAANLAAFANNPISTSGNITAGYFFGNGSGLTDINAANIVGAYGNANVTNFLGNGFGSNTITTTGNITSGNLLTGGVVSATGNVTANYFIGDGSLLTNITGANVTGTVPLAQYVTQNAQANITSVGTLTSLSVSGNVDGGNLRTAGVVTATGNINGGNLILPNGGRYYGDFTAATTAGRTAFQTTATGTTAGTNITVLPGINHTTSNTAFNSSYNLFASPDAGNSTIGSLRQFGNLTILTSIGVGTGTASNIRIATGSSQINLLTTGNVGIGNTAPQHGLAVQGTVWVGSSLTATGNVISTQNVITPTLYANAIYDNGTGNVAVITGNIQASGNIQAVNNIGANTVTATSYFSAPALFTSDLTPPGGGPLNTTTTLSTITGNLSVTGTIIGTGNITTGSFFKAQSYTAAALGAITGSIGQIAAVSDSAGGGNPNGMLAFWDTTNARWSYIHDNSAV